MEPETFKKQANGELLKDITGRVNEKHNRSSYQTFNQQHGVKNRSNTHAAGQMMGDMGQIGAHLHEDMLGDSDMMADEFADEGLNAGMHGHTQSMQIPQKSYVSGVFATGKLNRQNSKNKIIGPSNYSSSISKVHPTALTRRSTLTKQKSQASYVNV